MKSRKIKKIFKYFLKMNLKNVCLLYNSEKGKKKNFNYKRQKKKSSIVKKKLKRK